MKLSESELQQLYRRMTARRAGAPSDCPGEELIMRAAANDLSAAEQDRIAAHIGRCSDCAREYRIVRSVREVDPEVHEANRAGALGSRAWAVAAAAVIAILLSAVTWLAIARQLADRTIADLERRMEAQQQQLASARRQPAPAAPRTDGIAELVRPQSGVPIVDLDPGVTRGASAVVPSIVVPSTSSVFTLILHLNHAPATPVEVSLEDATGAVLWRDRVAPDPQSGTITLALHRRAVPAGTYTIHARSDRRTAFPFRVAYQSP